MVSVRHTRPVVAPPRPAVRCRRSVPSASLSLWEPLRAPKARARVRPNRPDRLPTIAAVLTEYRPRSHADVIVGKLWKGYLLDGLPKLPRVRVASMYVDQLPENDLSRDASARYGAPIYPTIE